MFQFLIGRVKIDKRGIRQNERYSFQFLIGRVKMGDNLHKQHGFQGFQFLIGRVKIFFPQLKYSTILSVSIPYR